MKTKILILIFLCISLFSCSKKNLSNEDAKTQIAEMLKNDNVQRIPCISFEINHSTHEGYFANWELQYIRGLLDKGYITYVLKQEGYNWALVNVNTLDKIKPYLVIDNTYSSQGITYFMKMGNYEPEVVSIT